MNIFLSIVDTALLVILFFYQHHKNKVLQDNINAQSKLIDETKSVVIQQATALEGQAKVVDAALKYSSMFDPKKLEDIIRREIDIDHKNDIEKLKLQFETDVSETKSDYQKRLQDVVKEVKSDAHREKIQIAMEMFRALYPLAVKYIISLNGPARQLALQELPEELRIPITNGLNQIDSEINKTTPNSTTYTLLKEIASNGSIQDK